jgi:hypothetical protein
VHRTELRRIRSTLHDLNNEGKQSLSWCLHCLQKAAAWTSPKFQLVTLVITTVFRKPVKIHVRKGCFESLTKDLIQKRRHLSASRPRSCGFRTNPHRYRIACPECWERLPRPLLAAPAPGPRDTRGNLFISCLPLSVLVVVTDPKSRSRAGPGNVMVTLTQTDLGSRDYWKTMHCRGPLLAVCANRQFRAAERFEILKLYKTFI